MAAHTPGGELMESSALSRPELRHALQEARPTSREAGEQMATAALARSVPVAVVDAGRTAAILDAFADRWSMKIICSTIERAKTVGEICGEKGLPQSSCYKRIKRLVDEGLMIVERRVVTADGKKSATYRSCLSFVSVKMVDGKVDVQASFNPSVVEKLNSRRLAVSS